MAQVCEIVQSFIQVLHAGLNCNFWLDNWTGKGPLIALQDFIPPNMLKATLSEVFSDEDNEILQLFSDEEQSALHECYSWLSFSTDNCFIWTATTTGTFNLSSAYHIVRRKNELISQNSWMQFILKTIWNKRFPLKISIFL